MSRRFRICVAKGGRGCFRPSYGRPKLTLVPQKKIEVSKISISSFMETEIAHLNRFFLYAMGKSDLSGQAQSP